LATLEKFWENPLLNPPGKIPSDAHGRRLTVALRRTITEMLQA